MRVAGFDSAQQRVLRVGRQLAERLAVRGARLGVDGAQPARPGLALARHVGGAIAVRAVAHELVVDQGRDRDRRRGPSAAA